MQGEVVGMNTAGLSDTGTFSGIGFAIPSNSITKIVPALIAKGYDLHPYLGIKGGALTSDLVENMTGIPANLSGVYVDTITKNGPADKAGLNGSTTDEYSKKHVGDIITAVDGHKVARIDDLASYIDQHKSVGDNITLTVYRHGHEANLKTILTARPSLTSVSDHTICSSISYPPPSASDTTSYATFTAFITFVKASFSITAADHTPLPCHTWPGFRKQGSNEIIKGAWLSIQRVHTSQSR